MKYIKLAIIGILIVAAMTVSGDLHQDYLRHFEYAFDNTSLNLPFKVNGEEMTSDILATAEKYNVKFLYSDFKKKEGYKKSIEMSKEYNLYRQDYCGCSYGRGIYE